MTNLDFRDHNFTISTLTVTVYCEWCFDLKYIYSYIDPIDIQLEDIGNYVAVNSHGIKYLPDKHKRKIANNIPNGSIIMVKFFNKMKGVSNRNIKSINTFPMSVSITIVYDGCFVNMKICQNKIQITGVKSIITLNTILTIFYNKIWSINDDKIFITPPKNKDFFYTCTKICMINVSLECPIEIKKSTILNKLSSIHTEDDIKKYKIVYDLYGRSNNINIKVNDDSEQYITVYKNIKHNTYPQIVESYKYTEDNISSINSMFNISISNKKRKLQRHISIMVFRIGKIIISGSSSKSIIKVYSDFVEDLKKIYD